MTKLAIRLMLPAIFFLTVTVSAPMAPLFAAGGGSEPSSSMPSQPSDNKGNAAPRANHKSKKANKQSFLEDTSFVQGYRGAYATIYERNDYASAIEQLKALGHEELADVANLIGYSYRKLGDYQLAQAWYERALKADPSHVRTWNYYGLWQIEQGNREAAQYHLGRIAAICGTDCDEYRTLAAALEQPSGAGLIY